STHTDRGTGCLGATGSCAVLWSSGDDGRRSGDQAARPVNLNSHWACAQREIETDESEREREREKGRGRESRQRSRHVDRDFSTMAHLIACEAGARPCHSSPKTSDPACNGTSGRSTFASPLRLAHSVAFKVTRPITTHCQASSSYCLSVPFAAAPPTCLTPGRHYAPALRPNYLVDSAKPPTLSRLPVCLSVYLYACLPARLPDCQTNNSLTRNIGKTGKPIILVVNMA
ncbi:unnamed protein product, partial [Protopolystoma xenopodis]